MKNVSRLTQIITVLLAIGVACLGVHALSKGQPTSEIHSATAEVDPRVIHEPPEKPTEPGEPEPRLAHLKHPDRDAGVSFPSERAGTPLVSTTLPASPALFSNYPNPFNPETWIPYQLSEAADVKVSIYSADGRLVRVLSLGHRGAGVYRSKSRAAYWDGRNAVGEPVGSGVYFYTLESGVFRATRKLLIVK